LLKLERVRVRRVKLTGVGFLHGRLGRDKGDKADMLRLSLSIRGGKADFSVVLVYSSVD
jgi:hypothetical protein